MNFTGTVTVIVAASNVLRSQGHGAIVVMCSVAGERVRKANPVYGATKAGIDGFAQGLGDRSLPMACICWSSAPASCTRR